MSEPRALPGPPPPPPADFARRTLPEIRVPEGSVVYRIYLTARTLAGALYYGPRADPLECGRWDSPTDAFGVCYLAETARLAFAETLLRDLDRDDVTTHELALRSLASVAVLRELRLLRLHGGHARALRASGVVQAPYATTQAWSQAIHDHLAEVDGVYYRSRLDDDAFAIALYARAAGAVQAKDSTELLDPALAAELGAWTDHYGIGLAP